MGGPRYIISVRYGWAQIGPPMHNNIISRTLRVGPDISYLSSMGGPT